MATELLLFQWRTIELRPEREGERIPKRLFSHRLFIWSLALVASLSIGEIPDAQKTRLMDGCLSDVALDKSTVSEEEGERN